jgi:hypothetical protein
MSDEGSVDEAKLIVYIQVALKASVNIFEFHLKQRWSVRNVLTGAAGPTYRHACHGNLSEYLEARLSEDAAHLAMAIKRRGQSLTVRIAYPIL